MERLSRRKRAVIALTEEDRKGLKERFREEYSRSFIYQAAFTLAAVIIAFVASVYMFGWLWMDVTFIFFIAYILAGVVVYELGEKKKHQKWIDNT